MWWRFLVFCVLVTLVLFIVLSCIYGRPVVHLFFHRCCGEDIENDQVIFENLGKNFLRERLIATEENTTSAPSEDVDDDSAESTSILSFSDVVRALKNNSLTDHVAHNDVTDVPDVTLFSFKDVDGIKSDFSTEKLLGTDSEEAENVTLCSFEVVDKDYKADLKTDLINKDSMEIENQFLFDDVGKAIDEMKRLINVHNPSTRDGYDELEADLTDDDVLEVTTDRLRKRH